MHAVIILRKISKGELAKVERMHHLEGIRLFCFDKSNIPAVLEDIPMVQLSLPQETIVQINKACFDEVIDLGHKLYKGKKILSWLSYRDHTFWYYIRFTLYYRYRAKVLNNKRSEIIRTALKEDEFEQIEVFTPSAEVDLPNDEKFNIHLKKSGSSLRFADVIGFFPLFLLRAILGVIQLPILLLKGKHIILFSTKANQPIISLNSKRVIEGDFASEYLLEKANSEGNFLLLSELVFQVNKKFQKGKFKSRFLFPRYPMSTFNFEFFMLLNVFNIANHLRVMKFRGRLKQLSRELSASTNSDFEHLLSSSLRSTHKMMLMALFREGAASLFLTFRRPRTLSGTGEYSIKNKPLFEAAKRRGITTFGMQHGVIHKLHIHYIYSAADAEYKPWPDHFIVWGQYWKDILLTLSSFPPEKILVKGQLRTDIIPFLNNEKGSLKEKKRPVLLYASQPLYEGDQMVRKHLATDFIRLAKDFPEVDFIVKPHPLEKDFTIFHELAKEMGTTNFQILQDDLYKLLSRSDIVLIFNSTVGAEAVYFLKNMVVMDYYENDFSGYITSKVAFKVENYEQLKQKIGEILNSSSAIDKGEQDQFIQDRVYKIDGNTTGRYIEAIKSSPI